MYYLIHYQTEFSIKMSAFTMKLFFSILVSFFAVIHSLHLSPNQMYSARGLLMNPRLTKDQRASIQNLLYVSHEKWAIKKATDFKQLHHYKCRDISIDELALSGKIGLLKSSRKYNGGSPFVKFSEIYVKSELLRAMTARLSVTSCISPTRRMQSRNATTVRYQSVSVIDGEEFSLFLQEPVGLSHTLPSLQSSSTFFLRTSQRYPGGVPLENPCTSFASHPEYFAVPEGNSSSGHFASLRLASLRLENPRTSPSLPLRICSRSHSALFFANTNFIKKISSHTDSIHSTQPHSIDTIQNNDVYASMWQYVDSLDAFTKRVVWLKYDVEFNVKCSNTKIAELMCCSEETVRKSLHSMRFILARSDSQSFMEDIGTSRHCEEL